ncbi:hypothetical protein TNCV_1987051 [Trichonephila clavipes]|nr:hypothetical protein TNCV_1987051 [Trichonephila clavipes]
MFQILLWSPWKYRCGQRTVRMAVVACSQNQAVFARRRIKVKAETLEKKLLDIRLERKENARGASLELMTRQLRVLVQYAIEAAELRLEDTPNQLSGY